MSVDHTSQSLYDALARASDTAADAVQLSSPLRGNIVLHDESIDGDQDQHSMDAGSPLPIERPEKNDKFLSLQDPNFSSSDSSSDTELLWRHPAAGSAGVFADEFTSISYRTLDRVGSPSRDLALDADPHFLASEMGSPMDHLRIHGDHDHLTRKGAVSPMDSARGLFGSASRWISANVAARIMEDVPLDSDDESVTSENGVVGVEQQETGPDDFVEGSTSDTVPVPGDVDDRGLIFPKVSADARLVAGRAPVPTSTDLPETALRTFFQCPFGAYPRYSREAADGSFRYLQRGDLLVRMGPMGVQFVAVFLGISSKQAVLTPVLTEDRNAKNEATRYILEYRRCSRYLPLGPGQEQSTGGAKSWKKSRLEPVPLTGRSKFSLSTLRASVSVSTQADSTSVRMVRPVVVEQNSFDGAQASRESSSSSSSSSSVSAADDNFFSCSDDVEVLPGTLIYADFAMRAFEGRRCFSSVDDFFRTMMNVFRERNLALEPDFLGNYLRRMLGGGAAGEDVVDECVPEQALRQRFLVEVCL